MTAVTAPWRCRCPRPRPKLRCRCSEPDSAKSASGASRRPEAMRSIVRPPAMNGRGVAAAGQSGINTRAPMALIVASRISADPSARIGCGWIALSTMNCMILPTGHPRGGCECVSGTNRFHPIGQTDKRHPFQKINGSRHRNELRGTEYPVGKPGRVQDHRDHGHRVILARRPLSKNLSELDELVVTYYGRLIQTGAPGAGI